MASNNYQVTGMTCGHCEMSVREEVGEIPGMTPQMMAAFGEKFPNQGLLLVVDVPETEGLICTPAELREADEELLPGQSLAWVRYVTPEEHAEADEPGARDDGACGAGAVASGAAVRGVTRAGALRATRRVVGAAAGAGSASAGCSAIDPPRSSSSAPCANRSPAKRPRSRTGGRSSG